MKPVYPILLSLILFVLPRPSDAAAITINNMVDNEYNFTTTVDGSVGSSSTTHTLVDIPNTPWVNSSTIVETNGSAGMADSLSVTWTSNHIKGPHPGDGVAAADVNPNPNEPVTLSLSFTPTAAGRYVSSLGPDATDPLGKSATIEHPLNIGEPHFDIFHLRLIIEVSGTFLGGFDIDKYHIEYDVGHCLSKLIMGPAESFICREQFPDLPPPPPPLLVLFGLDCDPADQFCSVEFASAPEPGTLALLLAGLAGVGAGARKRRRGSEASV